MQEREKDSLDSLTDIQAPCLFSQGTRKPKPRDDDFSPQLGLATAQNENGDHNISHLVCTLFSEVTLRQDGKIL